MFIPVLTSLFKRAPYSTIYVRKSGLSARKGGGGGGRGSSGGGRGGSTGGHKPSSGSGGSSSPAKSPASTKSIPISTSGKPHTATTYGSGGGKISTIPSGLPFEGRSEGGGTRTYVYGTYYYNYPSYPVGYDCIDPWNCGFPYYYWPVMYPAGENRGHEGAYGDANNSTRPGGPMAVASFISSSDNTTFSVMSDNSTVAALITTIETNCSSYLTDSSSNAPVILSSISNTSLIPQPAQAVQYYRSSSVVLSLDGYSNAAVLNNSTGPSTPLPSTTDLTLLDCLNVTIGQSVPLINGVASSWSAPGMGTLGLIWMFWVALRTVV
ncbi:hypothetical protein HWV62_15094 [Athelia sp. TMB]|nr:hypothetical protein HWV62_15094 [Athelia sp. TMB]